jgi:hypothetical protein
MVGADACAVLRMLAIDPVRVVTTVLGTLDTAVCVRDILTLPPMTTRVITITNLLPNDFPHRSNVEAAIRDALEVQPGVEWDVTLRDGLGITASDSVAVELRKGRESIAFASVNAGDSRSEIADCLRFFSLKP